MIHLSLLTLSLFSLPILPNPWWKPRGPEDPLLRILGLLTATVGLPYFLLSSTSPLLQSWYSRSNGGAMPYRFFALSNAGSMPGLLAYPVLVEPYLTAAAGVDVDDRLWRVRSGVRGGGVPRAARSCRGAGALRPSQVPRPHGPNGCCGWGWRGALRRCCFR